MHARLTRPQPIQLDDFRFLKSATSRTAKVCIPSPSMMIVQGGEKVIDPKVYPDPDLFFTDLSRVYAQEIADLAAAGCSYLQLDDTFLAFLCDEKIGAAFGRSGEDTKKMARLSARLINDAIRNRPSDMAVCIHLCRGNYQSSWLSEGGYDPVAEILLGEIDVDGYFLEYDDERSGSFAPLRFLPKGKKVVLGLVTSKHAQLEFEGCPQAAHRRGSQGRAARAAGHQPAMRIFVDRGRQRHLGGRPDGEAVALRQGRAGGVGRRPQLSGRVRRRSSACNAAGRTVVR